MNLVSVTKEYRTETGHRLSMYNGKCSHLHGHSYLWQVEATSHALTDNGMVIDFKHLKAAMEYVLEPLDHAMILYAHDPLVSGHTVEELQSLLRATNGQSPRLHIWPMNPTAENMAEWAANEIQGCIDQLVINDEMQPAIEITAVRVWETASSYAEWRANK